MFYKYHYLYRKYLDLDLSPSPEKVHRLVDNTLERFNHVVKRFKSIFLVEDIFDSLKVNMILLFVFVYTFGNTSVD